MTSHVGGIFWAMYYGEENYSPVTLCPLSLGNTNASLSSSSLQINYQKFPMLETKGV